LGDKVSLARNPLGSNSTVMFVAPDDEIDAVIEETLGNGFLWPMFDSGHVVSDH